MCVWQCYISMARHVLQRPSYKQWDCYRWTDFRERVTLATTFRKRHLPLSTGDKDMFHIGMLADPEEWNCPKEKNSKKVRRSLDPKTVDVNSAPETNKYAGKEYDSETDDWV